MKIIIPISGGKDSQVCLALAVDKYGAANCLAVHQHTGFDHPLTYAHMTYMASRYKVEVINIHNPKYSSVPEVMRGEKIIPTRLARACTRNLKTGPWFQWLAKQKDRDTFLLLLGMRAAESPQRRGNYGHLIDGEAYPLGDIANKAPKRVKAIQVQLPIVSWTTPAVFDFLRSRGDLVNPLYHRGFKRVGCFPCILAGASTLRLAIRDPVGRKHMEQVRSEVIRIQAANPARYYEHDLDKLLDRKEADPFGFSSQEDEEQAGGCSWCNI